MASTPPDSKKGGDSDSDDYSMTKRSYDEMSRDTDDDNDNCSSPTGFSVPHVSRNKRKLRKFRTEPLEDSIDYQAVQSALSLLRSRMSELKQHVKELNHFKKRIEHAHDMKELKRLVLNSTDYLNEITYKGCYIKCPTIQWKYNIGLDLEILNDKSYESIDEKYEIIERDKL